MLIGSESDVNPFRIDTPRGNVASHNGDDLSISILVVTVDIIQGQIMMI